MHYYFADHLGSASVVTNSAGSTPFEENLDYYPYGGIVATSTENVPQNYKFTGKERDGESGLDNFGARYDSSVLGRFMTPDWAAKPTTVPFASFGDPQTLNLYSYVENEPINKIDADGHLLGSSLAQSEAQAESEYCQRYKLSCAMDDVNEECGLSNNLNATVVNVLDPKAHKKHRRPKGIIQSLVAFVAPLLIPGGEGGEIAIDTNIANYLMRDAPEAKAALEAIGGRNIVMSPSAVGELLRHFTQAQVDGFISKFGVKMTEEGGSQVQGLLEFFNVKSEDARIAASAFKRGVKLLTRRTTPSLQIEPTKQFRTGREACRFRNNLTKTAFTGVQE